jgi:hypothetical protein
MAERKIPTSAGMETASETVARVKAMQASNTTNGSDNESFTKAVEKRLLGQSQVVSSFDTQLEQSYTDAAKGIREGNDASKARIESVYNRERSGIEQAGENSVTGFSEGRSGFATQMAGLRNVVQTTDKNLNDLMQRKEELILQGDSNAATQISGLIIDRLKFKQQAEQQVFSNLLGMANYGQQKEQSAAALAQSKSQFDQKMKYDETTAMTSIALEYGLQANPGETLTTLYSRASKEMGPDSPAALKIKQAQSEINRNNADIDRIRNEIRKSNEKKTEPDLANADLNAIVNAALANPATMGPLLQGLSKDQQTYVINTMSTKSGEQTATYYKNTGVSKDDAKTQIWSSASSVADKQAATNALDGVYGQEEPKAATDRFGIRDVGGGLRDASTAGWMAAIDFFRN